MVESKKKPCWSWVDSLLLLGVGVGVTTAIICGALVYKQYLREKPWKKADQCYVQGIDLMPRGLAQEAVEEMDEIHEGMEAWRERMEDKMRGGKVKRSAHGGHGGRRPYPGPHPGPHSGPRPGGHHHDEESHEHGPHPRPHPEHHRGGHHDSIEEWEESHEEGHMSHEDRDDSHEDSHSSEDSWFDELEPEVQEILSELGDKYEAVVAELMEAGQHFMDPLSSHQGSDETSHHDGSRSREDSDESDSSSEESDGSDSDEGSPEAAHHRNEDKECALMPCLRVTVTYQQDGRVGKGLLHPSIQQQQDMPMCSASACSHDYEKVKKEMADYVIPYAEALASRDQVKCFCNEENAEESHSFMEEAWCDLKDGLHEMLGGHREGKEGGRRDRDKRQVEAGLEPIVAGKKYESCATGLSVMVPMLFTVVCLLALLIRRCCLCCKKKSKSPRAEPYKCARGPSFIGKPMRTPSVWSLGSSKESKEGWSDKTSLPPSYDNALYSMFIPPEAPAYQQVIKVAPADDVMVADDDVKVAPPAYAFINEEQDEKKVDLSKVDASM